MSEKPQNSGNIVERNEDGTFKEGHIKIGGKEKGSRSFTTKVREALEKIAEGKNYTYEEAFIKAILKKSIVDQDTGMMRTVWEQLDGKPLQRMANADGSNVNPVIAINYIQPNGNNDKANTETASSVRSTEESADQ